MDKGKKEKHIWAIAGGKGGIGKSFVTANLGIALCERGKKVIVVDADLGGGKPPYPLGDTQTACKPRRLHQAGYAEHQGGDHGDRHTQP